MATTYVSIAAIDAVLGGTEYTLDDSYVALKDSVSGFDGPGSYHVQLSSTAGPGGTPGYLVTYGKPPGDSSSLMTVLRAFLTPTGVVALSDARKFNVGMTGVNATIMQTEEDGSYLADDVIVPRNIAGGVTALLDSIGLTQGDILYRNATEWVVLAPGTAGYVLTTGGAGANPAWMVGGGGGVTVVPLGTSYPGSPATGELFFRTDLQALFIWTGSAWLSANTMQSLNDVSI